MLISKPTAPLIRLKPDKGVCFSPVIFAHMRFLRQDSPPPEPQRFHRTPRTNCPRTNNRVHSLKSHHPLIPWAKDEQRCRKITPDRKPGRPASDQKETRRSRGVWCFVRASSLACRSAAVPGRKGVVGKPEEFLTSARCAFSRSARAGETEPANPVITSQSPRGWSSRTARGSFSPQARAPH